MKIVKVTIHHLRIPLKHAVAYSSVAALTAFDSTVVRLEGEDGLVGWGEVCPLGRTYLPVSAEGVRAALAVLGPAVLGCDPANLNRLHAVLDGAMKGEAGAKSAIETACWDLVGQAQGRPVSDLLGGALAERVPVPGTLPNQPPGEMVARMKRLRDAGYRYYSPKLSGDIEDDLLRVRALLDAVAGSEFLIVDANGALNRGEALRLADLLRGAPVWLEQPCATYQECRDIARRVGLPFIFDEIMTGPGELYRAWADGVIDGLKLKVSRVGGLSAARRMTEFCAETGITVWVQEAAGGEIAQAAAGHLAVAVPGRVLGGAVDLCSMNAEAIATGGAWMADGLLRVSDTPGLGVAPDLEKLGAPAHIFELD